MVGEVGSDTCPAPMNRTKSVQFVWIHDSGCRFTNRSGFLNAGPVGPNQQPSPRSYQRHRSFSPGHLEPAILDVERHGKPIQNASADVAPLHDIAELYREVVNLLLPKLK
jgi:hypothetical protein